MKNRHSGTHVAINIANSPTGEEIIVGNECEEPTRIIRIDHLEYLLRCSDPHKHDTVVMNAVKIE